MKMQKLTIFIRKKLKINMLKTNNIVKLKLGTTLIIPGNIEVLEKTNVIESIVYLKKFP